MFSRLIPSMFIRRLSIVAALLLLASAVPVLRLGHLTLVRGEEMLREAEKRLVVERMIPTHRGRILDRKGRVLAMDRPGYDIAVDYRVITGEWAYAQASRRARSLHRHDWNTLSPTQREELIARYLPEFQETLTAMWLQFAAVAGMPPEAVEERKAAIKAEVQMLAASTWEELRRRREAALLERGRELTTTVEESSEGAAGSGSGGRRRASEIVQRAGRRDGEGGGAEGTEVRTGAVAGRIREQVIPHAVLRGVDDRTAFEFLRLVPPAGDAARLRRELPEDPFAPEPMPGLRVIDSSQRQYPFDEMDVEIDRSTFPTPLRSSTPARVKVEGVAIHTIGWMRDRLLAEDEAKRREALVAAGEDPRRDRGRYMPGDSVGSFGLEATAEFTLRGLRGVEGEKLDTGETTLVPPENGRDVLLTLDIGLQARIQALFDPSVGLAVIQPWQLTQTPQAIANYKGPPVGTPLAGAAVVLDIDSGDILALVSAPGFSRRMLAETPEKIFADSLELYGVNRAVAKPYQPGSIVKPLVLAAAGTGGHYHAAQRIACNGHFLPGRTDMLRCWIFKMNEGRVTHSMQFGHDLSGAEALMVSCNIFFFELGRRMGSAVMCEWFSRFGVGRDARRTPVLEYPGVMGRGGRPPQPSEAVQMAIGQGPIAWTPLHAADAYATLARGSGVRILPRLRMDEPAEVIDLRLDPGSLGQALDGLELAVSNTRGTAHHLTIEGAEGQSRREPIFNAPGVSVWAKTGTADASPLRVDTTGDGIEDAVRGGDHAWTVCLVGERGDRPRYAIAVVVDYGGSGGKVAGPIANQVIYALMAEGYLPCPQNAGGRAERLP